MSDNQEPIFWKIMDIWLAVAPFAKPDVASWPTNSHARWLLIMGMKETMEMIRDR